MAQDDDGTLFPQDLPEGEWSRFAAHGYTEPVCGLVRKRRSAATSGMPLGGIDTGALSLETNGTLGYCTIFNSIVLMRGPLGLPFLGMSVGDQSWILTTDSLAAN